MSNELTISEAQKITGDFKAAVIKLEQIQKNQNLLFEMFEEIIHKDNKFFMQTQSIFDMDNIPTIEECTIKQAKMFFETMVQMQSYDMAFRGF